MQLHAAYAMARRGEQIDRIEPVLQRRARLLEDRAGAGVDVTAAMRAAIGLAVLKAMERSVHDAAHTAVMAKAKSDIHQAFKAGGVIREPLEELADRKLA